MGTVRSAPHSQVSPRFFNVHNARQRLAQRVGARKAFPPLGCADGSGCAVKMGTDEGSSESGHRAADRPAGERLTILVTTSPIPSHPSPVLLRTLFASFRQHLPGLAECPRLLVCDGYERDDGRPQLCPAQDYDGFLCAAEQLAETGELGHCKILRLGSNHGYGLALAAALQQVTTEFVLVVQHDWLFVKDVDMASVVKAFDLDPVVKYIGMQSLTTLGYPNRIKVRYGLELPPPRRVGSLELVPQLLWYDKPHVCRVSHYQQVVLPEACMRVRENPERRYGVEKMWPKLRHAEDLEKEHLNFGTFFIDVGMEVVYHLSGRKLHAAEGPDSELLAPLPVAAEISGVASSTATYTALAVDREVRAPGLAALAQKPVKASFKGRCFLCGQKGHSKLHCELRGTLAPGPPEVAAGCGSEAS